MPIYEKNARGGSPRASISPMPQNPPLRALILATHNTGKTREMTQLLKPYNLKLLSATALGLPEPEETGKNFAENASLKALSAAQLGGMAALADDSGLCVEALDGAPGIHSARWAGVPRDFARASALIARALKNKQARKIKERRAHFLCCLALAQPSGEVQIFEGKTEGSIIWPPRGANGFGYDPIFLPRGFSETFGEMDPAKKETLSHRARAFSLFADHCLKRPA